MRKMILETERLSLREMNDDDFNDLCKILQDKDVMYAYEHAFSNTEVWDWLERQKARYIENGFGLWAVLLKATGEMIGQCGITMQEFSGRQVHEIGYLFQKKYWHKGYAIEAASACKNYAFNILQVDEVFSIIRDNNFPSQKVAVSNEMVKVGELTKHYHAVDMPHIVYCVKKEDTIN